MGAFDTSQIHEIAGVTGERKSVRVQDGHLFVCHGCCCGRTEKGFPPLPIDEFKRQWKARGIRRRFHLTISGCLGPCTLANVVLVQFRGYTVWLHSIRDKTDVDLIYEWAEQMLRADNYLPPPVELSDRHFQRYVVDSLDQSECAVSRHTATSTDADYEPDLEHIHDYEHAAANAID